MKTERAVVLLMLGLLAACGEGAAEGGLDEADAKSPMFGNHMRENGGDGDVAYPLEEDVGGWGYFYDVVEDGAYDGGDAVGSMEDGCIPMMGVACEGNGDCDTAICLQYVDGKRCAVGCGCACPQDHSCAPSPLGGQDEMYVCLPDSVQLCRPCRDDEECMRYPDDPGVRCAQLSPEEGSFCMPVCDTDTDCPPEYTCAEDGACRPPETCDCTESAGNQGLSTDCATTSDAGMCMGMRTCEHWGMSECSGQVPYFEVCDGIDSDCDGQTDEEVAAGTCSEVNEHGTCQGDLVCIDGKEECQAKVPAQEACDGQDNDCDGEVDEGEALGCQTFYLDADGDGYGGSFSTCACSKPATGAEYTMTFMDCDDMTASVHPFADEPCDGLDNDCDTFPDDGCDADGDGFCAKPMEGAVGPGFVCKFVGVDCNDADMSVSPGAEDLCNGQDDDCDLDVDEECDKDGDGYCGKTAFVAGPAYVCKYPEPDCKDKDPQVHPAGIELCNFQDDDCDAAKDEGCDADGDGFCGGQAVPLVGCANLVGMQKSACEASFYLLTCPGGFGDCNDLDAALSPDAKEMCNGIDDDCDGKADEDLDLDKDGFCGVPVQPGLFCAACPKGGDDCNDGNKAVNPEAADAPDLEGVDSNCDGLDGVESECVFVSASKGNDTWPGSKKMPRKTIQGGVAQAAASPFKTCVLVAKGTYNGMVNLPSGEALWGGFDDDNDWKVSQTAKTLLVTTSPGITIDTGDAGTAVGRMSIEITGVEQSNNGVGVHALNVKGLLLAGLNVKVASANIPGASGTNGKNGAQGAQGKNGPAGCDGSGCIGGSGGCPTDPANGADGPGHTCGGLGGGKYIFSAFGFDWDPDVLAECSATANGGFSSGPSCCFTQVSCTSTGGQPGEEGEEEGDPGFPGGKGTNGANGAWGKGAKSHSPYANPWYWTNKATDGEPGTNGCGGGGGGEGADYDEGWLWCNAWGGYGGGGGAGGTAGTGGTAGKNGASVFGIALFETSGTVKDCVVTVGNGANGGAGGNGLFGGFGGQGGNGGAGYDGSGPGGKGGDGGYGGNGGGGGGGAGGASIGLLRTCGYDVQVSNLTATVGKPGTGGKGGKTGTFAAPASANGADGLSGKDLCL